MAADGFGGRPGATAPERPLRFIGRVILSVLVILWTLLQSLMEVVLGPLLRLLGGFPLFALIGEGLARLPPYAALVALAIPFAIIEPIKAYTLYWFGIGHYIQGGIGYVLAHLASLLIVDRIYHAAHAPLMRIGWFARLMGWLDALRQLVLGWARATPIWQSAARLAETIRTAFRRAVRRAG
jgi:hypothetical protein